MVLKYKLKFLSSFQKPEQSTKVQRHLLFVSSNIVGTSWNRAVDFSAPQTHFPPIFHNRAQICVNPVHQRPSVFPLHSDDNEQRRLNLNSQSKGLPGGRPRRLVSSRDKKLFAICVIQLNHRSFDGETTGAIWTLHLGGTASRWRRRLRVQLPVKVSHRRTIATRFTQGGSAWKNKACWEEPLNNHWGENTVDTV